MVHKLNVRQTSHMTCQACSLNNHCLSQALKTEDIDEFDKLIKRRRYLEKGEHLFLAGTPFHSLYAVRSGTLKTYTTHKDDELITDFYFPSELLDLSGFDTETYPISAQAIETTMICEIPFSRLKKLSDHHPELCYQLMRIMCRKIRKNQQMKLLLSRKNSDERVATFLTDLVSRFHGKSFSSQSFRLSMSRNDIGNYLGLTVETVSRVFTRLQKNGLINANGKTIKIINAVKLHSLAVEHEDSASNQ